ncbi:hypothetical protein ACLB1G_04050 [Oxalobacteraceae bacterium A2-2]
MPLHLTKVCASFSRTALLGIAFAPGPSTAGTAPDWPSIPAAVTSFDTGGEVSTDGLSIRLQGLLSARAPAEVAALFRASLGRPLTESRQGTRLILGRSWGNAYLTVQLEQAGTGTRGIMGISRPAGGAHGQALRRIWSKLPAGCRELRHTSISDAGRRTEMLVAATSSTPAFIAGQLRSLMLADGYAVNANTRPGSGPAPATIQAFELAGTELNAIIMPMPDGSASMVIHIASQVERKP